MNTDTQAPCMSGGLMYPRWTDKKPSQTVVTVGISRVIGRTAAPVIVSGQVGTPAPSGAGMGGGTGSTQGRSHSIVFSLYLVIHM